MCWLCLLFIAAIWLGDLTGIMPVRSPDIRLEEDGRYIGEKGQALICGRICQYIYSENSMGICLKDVYLRSRVGGISKKLAGRVVVYMQEDCGSALPLGTWAQVSGRLQKISGPRNPGEFDSRLYHQTKKIYYRMSGQGLTAGGGQVWHLREGLRQLREKLACSLEKAVPKEAGILCAMVVGEKRLLGQEEKNLLAAGSLSHIISISGMHLSLLGMMCFYLFQRLGLGIRPASAAAVGMMILYGLLAGESVATMRALGMFGLAMTARIVGRSYDLLSALSLSVILLLLDNPAYLYYSGFLLSCGCICAVGLVLPLSEQIFSFDKIKNRIVKKLGQTLQMGVVVQMTTLPLILWSYYEVPLYGVLINLLAVSTLGIVLVCGWAGAAAGLWMLPAARIFLFPACVLIRFYQFLCETAKGLPGAVLILGKPEMWQVVVYYCLLVTGLFFGRRLISLKKEKRWRAAGTALVLLCWLSGTLSLCCRSHGSLEITCLDVGQGDGAVIRTSKGACFLVDGGSSSQKKVGRYTILPFLKSRGIGRVDAVFVSHTDADHINGIEEIFQMIRTGQTSLRISRLVFPGTTAEDPDREKLALLAVQAGTEVSYMNVGDQVRAGPVSWQALSPPSKGQTGDINEDSLVLLLEEGGFQGLFTGDIGEERESALAGRLADCDFLKVAHHGSRYSTGDGFLAEVRPEVAVASASATNTYGHPHPDTLARLKKNRCHVFLTKDSGAVTLDIKDGMIRAETYLH